MDICHPFFRRITVGTPVSEIIGNQLYCVLKQDISQTYGGKRDKKLQIQCVRRYKSLSQRIYCHIRQNCWKHTARLRKKQPYGRLNDFLRSMEGELPDYLKHALPLLSFASFRFRFECPTDGHTGHAFEASLCASRFLSAVRFPKRKSYLRPG